MSERLSTVDRAKNRWRQILPSLGIGEKFLTKRHGPCPLCRGVDRFRFDDKDGSGSYYCNQCGPGTGLILVRKLHDWDHKTACDEIDRIIGTDSSTETSKASSSPSHDTRRRAIENLLHAANAPEVVSRYLARRGLTVTSDVLLGHKACDYWSGAELQRLPAVIAPITSHDGDIESVLRIYDADVDPRKKIMSPVRTIKGAAVRLFHVNDVMAAAEGVETALAVHQLTGLPVWALLSEGNMREWSPPAGIQTVAVYGDNDSNFVGQAASHILAKRLRAKDIIVTVHIPPKPDTDWLDVLIEDGAR